MLSIEKTPPTADYGCGYLVWMGVVIVGMILINSSIVDLTLERWELDQPLWLEDPRIQSAVRKIAPFLLLICEYWVWDFFMDRWRKLKPVSSMD